MRLVSVIVCCLMAIGGIANADAPSAPEGAESLRVQRDAAGYWPREGLFHLSSGGGLGVASAPWDEMDCAACDADALLVHSADVQLGFQVRRDLSLIAASALVAADPERRDASTEQPSMYSVFAAAGVQNWLTPRWSVRGMVGARGTWTRLVHADGGVWATSGPDPVLWADAEYEAMSRFSRSLLLGWGAMISEANGRTASTLLFTVGFRFYATMRR